MQALYLLVPLAPLFGALIAGLFCRVLPHRAAHSICILGVATAFVGSVVVFLDVLEGNTFNGPVYLWLVSGENVFQVGFLIDSLTAVMMLVVTSVSLMVHIYTIGYMRDDPGYNRFFSYIALFTFAMLMLVMSNNFMQLFFGWEAVGLVSYLLIGFWYERPSAVFANMKAFIVNRVGDFGFILGIGLIFAFFGTLDYADVFRLADENADVMISLFGPSGCSLMTVICILLFIGAMGKSAQVPLHVWLPDSMEGPTPISALIHAATMVTAGIFMVARMSPLFELSETALSFVMTIGAVTALFMGFLAIIQNDIKRIVAYSTLSQLGYMTAALGASAYSAAILHLMTHAFFKALLFLAAGSVIVGMHHDQDIRNMGGLRKYMPITWLTTLIGTLALVGAPFFSGFYSKDAITHVVALSEIPGSGFASFALTSGVFLTAFYSFRMFFLVFYGKERFGTAHSSSQAGGELAHGFAAGQKPHESPWTMTFPLVLLAIPSLLVGGFAIEPMLFGNFFRGVIVIDEAHSVMEKLLGHFGGPLEMALEAPASPIFWLMLAGIVLAWFFYVVRPSIPAAIRANGGFILTLLENKYYFDRFYETILCRGVHLLGVGLWKIGELGAVNGFYVNVIGGGARLLGAGLWKIGDVGVIDGLIVGGSVRLVGFFSNLFRLMQSGRLARYALTMISGVCAFLSFWLLVQMNWITL